MRRTKQLRYCFRLPSLFRFGCLVGSLWLCSSALWAAPNVWQRARVAPFERKLLQSTRRVLAGSSDDRDLLTVRTGLVELSRGSVSDPQLVLLLVRLRRQLNLSPARGTQRQLLALKKRRLAPLLRSDLSRELALFYLAGENTQLARRELAEALRYAWLPATRARLFVLRGFVTLAGLDAAARNDFDRARQLTSQRGTLLQAAVGLALSHALRRDLQGHIQAARQAYFQKAARASVSGADPFAELALSAGMRVAASLVLAKGRALVAADSDAERGSSLDQDVCAALAARLAGARSHPAAQAWLIALEQMWRPDCPELRLQPAPPLAPNGEFNDGG